MGNRWRSIPLAATIAVLCLIAAGLVAAGFNEARYRQQRQQAADVQAAILASSVTAALDFKDVQAATDAVNSLRADSSIAVAAVYDAEGSFWTGFARNGGRPLQELSRAQGPREGRVASIVPVTQGNRLGYVYVESTVQPLAERLSGYLGIGLLVGMGVLVVVVLGTAQAALGRANAKLRQEIAERAKVEAALAQAQKIQALGQLTSGIAHDFNNLLTAVVGGLDLILRRSDDAKIRRLAENSIKAAERGTKLTGQLLTFSRSQKLELKPLLVAPLIEGMSDLFRRTLGPSVEVRLSLADVVVPVMADAMQLELAVLNLAINARDAMPAGGEIVISTKCDLVEADQDLETGEYLEIRVSDTGTGMPPEVAERAFDPFYTTKGVGKGTGLGLSMVYGLAKQCGGVARIQTKPGVGTSVSIILPRAKEAPKASVNQAEQRRLVATQTRSIVVVDDDDDVRSFIVGGLETAGHSVRQARDALDGLELISESLPDIVVTDFAMPGMNGAELAQSLQARYPALPVILVSGYADADALSGIEATARILRKPFRAEQLLTAIEEAVNSRAVAADTGAPALS